VKPDVLNDEDVARWMQGKFGKIVAYTRSREREAQRDADYEHEQNTIREIFEGIEKTGVLRDHRYVVEGTMRQEETHYPERCSLCAYQSLKGEFLKEAA